MGRTITPKFRVETTTNIGYLTPFSWSGAPTPKRLADWVRGYNESFKSGGTNEQAGQCNGRTMQIMRAWIVRQTDGHVMTDVLAVDV
jgi:hypothetical protein